MNADRFSDHPDIVVVGAGAAGLSATRTLQKQGITVTLVEASNRIGGRAWTDTATFGVPYDVGAHWLHNNLLNPYNEYGKRNGFEVYRDPNNIHFSGGNAIITDEISPLLSSIDQLYEAIEAAATRPSDKSVEEATRHILGHWAPTAKFVVGTWSMGKELNEISSSDMWELEDDHIDWFCKEGFGSLVAHYGSGIPVSLNTAVQKIDWSGNKVTVETTKGTLRCRAVILTVSTGVLSSGNIAFSPALPVSKQESFNAISMGNYEHICLQFSGDVFQLGADAYILRLIEHGEHGFGGLLNSSGSGLAYCDFGGDHAKEISQESEQAQVDYTLGELREIFGSHIDRAFVKGAATSWGSNQFTCGSYASAVPGAYKLRKILRKPVAKRIFFAGEACHQTLWASVGGAHLSGVKIATKVASQLASV